MAAQLRHPLACLASLAFLGYLGWNGYWLVQVRVPPSILLRIAGLPAPTTGMTRSVLALVRGDGWAHLAWNPFSLPVMLLVAVSLVYFARYLLWDRDTRLPRPVGVAWVVILAEAWLWKLASGPAWW